MDFQATPVQISYTDNGCNIAIMGAVHTNVAWLENELKNVVAKKPKLVELDLSKMTFLSSTGIGLFIWLRNKIMAEGGSVRISAIRKAELTSLRYAHVAELFQIGPATTVSS